MIALAHTTAFLFVCAVFLPAPLRAQDSELERLRAQLVAEHEARLQAEADFAEALDIAHEVAARADATLMGAPTQRVPHSESIVYVDQLPPGVSVEDTIRFESSDDRGWLAIMLGNDGLSVPLNGQWPFPMRTVLLDGVTTSLFLVPPGSTGYVVPSRLSYEVIRIVRFEGSALSASGLRFAGVKFVRNAWARQPHGRMFTDGGFLRSGGEVDAVKAMLIQSRPLVP